MARSAVGMEVNEGYILAVVLRRGRRGLAVAGFARVDHGGAVGAQGVVDPVGYRQAFEEALAKAGAGRANLCIAVTYRDVDVRELEFPIMPERDLEYTIRFELSNVVRFSGGVQDELLFDYAPLPGDQQHGRRRLLAISLPRRVVRSYLDPLYTAGIYPEILEAGAFSLPRVCPREGGVCYLHTAASGAQLLIYEAGEFRVGRQIGVNLAPLLEETRRRLAGDIHFEDPLATVAFEELALAVERTLEYHRARRRASLVSDLIDGVVVSGELGRDPRFTADFGQRIGVPTTAADPIIGPGDAGIFHDEAPLYAVACGMGARGLETL